MLARLSIFRSSPNGKTKKTPVMTSKLVRMLAGVLLIILPIICGPRSPTTTKYAMHVPNIKPMIKSSARNLPMCPNAWNASSSKLRLLDITADLMRKWQASLDKTLHRNNSNTASTIPHCLKQKGIARTLTPMMLLASVITCDM